jgi:hypothetical protein
VRCEEDNGCEEDAFVDAHGISFFCPERFSDTTFRGARRLRVSDECPHLRIETWARVLMGTFLEVPLDQLA